MRPGGDLEEGGGGRGIKTPKEVSGRVSCRSSGNENSGRFSGRVGNENSGRFSGRVGNENSGRFISKDSGEEVDWSRRSNTSRATANSTLSGNFTIECGSIVEGDLNLLEGEDSDEDEEEDDDGEKKDDEKSSSRSVVSILKSLSLISSLSSPRVCPEGLYIGNEEVFNDNDAEISDIEDDFSDIDDMSDVEENTNTTRSSKKKLKSLVQMQHLLNQDGVTVADVVQQSVAENTAPVKSKHQEKLQQAQKERRKSLRLAFKNRRKSRWELLVLDIRKGMKSSSAIAFYIWSLWLTVGTLFYSLEENLTVSKSFYVSTSIGYGIFWYDQTTFNYYAKLFSTLHFFIGVFGVSFAMALFARSLISRKNEWFNEAKQKLSIEAALATKGRWDDVVTYFNYYWPKLYVHFFFLVWMLLGIVWGVTSIKWSVLDAWLFSMTAMATGGLVSLPSSGVHELDYVFVSVYIIVGAPLMAIACGISAHAISNYGRSSKMEGKVVSAMTEDELVMMKLLGVEDGDGYIDCAEFTILILVRIGALNPDLIGVLFDRYHDLDRDDSGDVTYESLQKAQSFMGPSMLMPFSFKGSMKGSALVRKLRLDSMGG
jgi:hypothetical protein